VQIGRIRAAVIAPRVGAGLGPLFDRLFRPADALAGRLAEIVAGDSHRDSRDALEMAARLRSARSPGSAGACGGALASIARVRPVRCAHGIPRRIAVRRC